MYHYLVEDDNIVESPSRDFFLNKMILLKVSLFVRRLLNNRLPTKDNLTMKDVLNNLNILCIGGCESEESLPHLFFLLSIV